MVNYIKKFTIRLIISILIITLLMFMGEFILKCIYSNDWYHENKIINNMNIDKLQNKNWDYNPLWIHEGEDIPTKKEGSKRIQMPTIYGGSNLGIYLKKVDITMLKYMLLV